MMSKGPLVTPDGFGGGGELPGELTWSTRDPHGVRVDEVMYTTSGEEEGYTTPPFPLFTLVSNSALNYTPKYQHIPTLITTDPPINTTYYTTYYSYSTSDIDTKPDPEFLVMIPILILSLIGVYGNSVVIYTLSNMEKRSHHMLVMLSLAFSDFISCCFLMPCICLSSVTHARPLGDKWCEIFPYLNTTVLYSSFGHLGLISFEQCFRLWNPSLYKQIVTRNVIKFTCFLVWLFAGFGFLYPIKRLMRVGFYKPIFTCLFLPKAPINIGQGITKERAGQERNILLGVTHSYKVLILLLMCFSYCLIFIKLFRGDHGDKIRKRNCLSILKTDKAIKSAMIMLLVILVFVCSWMPDFVLQIIAMTSASNTWQPNTWLLRYTLYNYYISPVLNPAIYSLGYKHVRRQMISSLKRSNKNKFVSLEDGPPLLYRTEEQIKQAELFYKKVDAIEARRSSSLISDNSDLSTRPSRTPSSTKHGGRSGGRNSKKSEILLEGEVLPDLDKPYRYTKRGEWGPQTKRYPQQPPLPHVVQTDSIREAPGEEGGDEPHYENCDWDIYEDHPHQGSGGKDPHQGSRGRDLCQGSTSRDSGPHQGSRIRGSNKEITSSSDLSSVTEEEGEEGDREGYMAVCTDDADDSDAIEACQDYRVGKRG